MSPPLPPLPPSGPPSGLNFSRCTDAQPLPPSPAAACSTTRSTKVAIGAVPLSVVCRAAAAPGKGRGRTGRPGPPSKGSNAVVRVLLRRSRGGRVDRHGDDVDDATLAL